MDKEDDKKYDEEGLEQLANDSDLPEGLSKKLDNIINDDKYDDSTEIDLIGDKQEDVEDVAEVSDDVKLEDKVDDGGEKVEPEPAGVEGYDEIDSRLIAAARRFGWSDEKIVRVAEDDETILQDLANLVDTVVSQQGLTKTPVKLTREAEDISDDDSGLKGFELNSEELKRLEDEHGKDVTNLIGFLSTKLNDTINELNTMKSNVDGVRQTDVDRETKNKLDLANTAFDSAAEVFPILGETNKLNMLSDGSYDREHPSFKARDELFTVAQSFEQMGLPFDKAIGEALNWYAGKSGVKRVEDKMVKELNLRKKKFTNRPSRKKTEQTFASEDERIENQMSEVYNNLGLND